MDSSVLFSVMNDVDKLMKCQRQHCAEHVKNVFAVGSKIRSDINALKNKKDFTDEEYNKQVKSLIDKLVKNTEVVNSMNCWLVDCKNELKTVLKGLVNFSDKECKKTKKTQRICNMSLELEKLQKTKLQVQDLQTHVGNIFMNSLQKVDKTVSPRTTKKSSRK